MEQSLIPKEGVVGTLGAAFFGFTLGAILYGITILQVYQYFTTYIKDSRIRKMTVAFVSFLDTLHLTFAIYMMYSFVVEYFGDANNGERVVWSLKALGTVQVFFIVFVQCLYLQRIWKLCDNMFLSPTLVLVIHIGIVIIFFAALGVGIVFLVAMQSVNVILNFDPEFEYIFYAGYGTTTLIDCTIAAAMCIILHKSRAGNDRMSRTDDLLSTLIQYCVASGLLTSLASLLCIVLYASKPQTLLYLGVEFSMTRLYANSVIAMFNARRHLRSKLDGPMDHKIASTLLFLEPEEISPTISLTGTDRLEPKVWSRDIKHDNDDVYGITRVGSRETFYTSRSYSV